MLTEENSPLVERIVLIKKNVEKVKFLWSYFDLIKDVLLATGFQEKDGGDGKEFVLTIPKDDYNRLSFTIGRIRILGIGHALNEKTYGITFIYADIGRNPEGHQWLPWRWSEFKETGAVDKKPYLTKSPDDLVKYGEVRLKWMKSVFDIAVLQSKNVVEYGRHCPIIYRAAMDQDLRQQIFREAGIEAYDNW